MQFHKTPRILHSIFPELTWRKHSSEAIYLTFDDGPHPEITNWVFETLDNFDARATFFCVGENLSKYPEIQSKAIEKGHVVANHTYNHLKGWETDNARYIQNIDKCDQHIEKPNNLFRPPYGRIKRSQIHLLKDREIVMWSHLSWDFDKNMNHNRSIELLSKANPGSILVFHDSIKAFDNLKIILEPILEKLSSRRLLFKTLL